MIFFRKTHISRILIFILLLAVATSGLAFAAVEESETAKDTVTPSTTIHDETNEAPADQDMGAENPTVKDDKTAPAENPTVKDDKTEPVENPNPPENPVVKEDKAKETKTQPAKDTTKKSSSKKQATIMLVGDLMCQPKQQIAAGKKYNFKPTFEFVKPIFDSADLVVGNLETLISKSSALSKNKKEHLSKPYLNSPEQFLKALKYAGFDGLVTANNHCCDNGEKGLVETIKALDRQGFAHTGTFDSAKDKRYMLLKANGIKVGILSYTTYFNQKEYLIPAGKRAYMLNRLSESAAKRDVQALRRAGADYIIAYNHSGTEYLDTPTDNEERYARILAEAGVDHVINSHPHVLQPYDQIKVGKKIVPVMYSMGNFTSHMWGHQKRETLILSLTLERGKNGKVKLKEQTYYPCYILKNFRNKSYVLMPEVCLYNGDLSESSAKNLKKKIGQYYNNIRAIMKPKIPYLTSM